MKNKIIKMLKEIEKKNDVKIVMAIESGSRAWGFASKDSDYDVRCIHVGKLNDYLGLDEPPRQINEFRGNLDIESWDIRKFTELSLKSNPQIAEWLRSPIVYVDLNIIKDLRNIFDKGCSMEYLKIHYLRMANQNYHKYMGMGLAHSCKKYLYVLRGIACTKFIEKNNKIPPLPYKEVISYLPDSVKDFFEKCVIKKNSTEKAKISANPQVTEFIEKQFTNLPKFSPKENFSKKQELNKFLNSKQEIHHTLV